MLGEQPEDHASFWLSKLCVPGKFDTKLTDKILREVGTAQFVVEQAVVQQMRTVHYAVRGECTHNTHKAQHNMQACTYKALRACMRAHLYAPARVRAITSVHTHACALALAHIRTCDPLPDYLQDEEVPLVLFEKPVLAKVIEYLEYHHRAAKENIPEDNQLNWDNQFARVDDSILFSMILAANFLDIKPLLDLCCKKVAECIKECTRTVDSRCGL